ncbi:MAG: hypothetical protein Q7R85_00185 [bacterium]|nr:hypothetical protein [bacterium]
MLNLLVKTAHAITIANPLGYNTISDLICGIAAALAVIAGAIAVIMVLYGAFQILTAGGEPKKFEEGRHTIIYAAIGLAVVLLASGIVSLVGNILGDAGIQTGIFSCGRGAPTQNIPVPIVPERNPLWGNDFPIPSLDERSTLRL